MNHLWPTFFLLASLAPGPIHSQQESKIIPSTASENGWFGASVSIDHNVAIIGAPGNPNFAGNPGSAFLFERAGNTWVERARFVKPNGKEMDLFGHAVSISGEIAVVGAPRDDVGFNIDNGSVYVYEHGESGWSFLTRLTPDDTHDGQQFGFAVDIHGNTIIIGGINANEYKGAAYIFERIGLKWVQQVRLIPEDGIGGGLFGYSVAISEDFAIVGQPEGPAGGSGSAYIYRRNGSNWALQSKITGSDNQLLDDFGISVDISTSYAIVGAPKQDFENGAEYDEGAAYIFNLNGSQITKLRIKEGLEGFAGQFNVGTSVAISNSQALVGAIGSGSEEGMTGAAYLFNGPGWEDDSKLLAGDGTTEDFFGIAVSISQGCPLIGARRDWSLEYESGSAYLYCGNTSVVASDEISVDLTIHRPKVLDKEETVIPEPDEWNIGAQTFVNLDNDDHDFKFDYEDPDGVEGDDELVLLELKLEPGNQSTGELRLEATAGAEYIRLWHNPDKTAEVSMPLNFDMATAAVHGFVAKGNVLIKSLWVEGIRPHSVQRSTKLKLTYLGANDNCKDSCQDEVTLTIIGIKSQNWKGRQNGFTPDSVSFDSNILDIDPNFPAGKSVDELLAYGGDLPMARRIFAGSRAPEYTTPRDRVDLEIELTVIPVENVDLYAKSFDCDDPSTDKAFVDPNDWPQSGQYSGTNIRYSFEEDNRGVVPSSGKAGYFTGQDADGIVKLTFTTSGTKQKSSFKVSEYPGDNYRVVVNGDKDFLKQLRNLDYEDGFRIVDAEVTGSAADREIPYASYQYKPVYASDVLTVWRLLHVENDVMMDPPDNNPAIGNIINLNAAFSQLFVDTKLDDSSADLDSSPPLFGNNTCENQPPGEGRFERGKMIVAGATEIQIDANGKDYVLVSGGANIANRPLLFTAVNSLGEGNNGQITGVIREEGWRLTLDFIDEKIGVIEWSHLKDGVISIDGGPLMTITEVYPNSNAVEVVGLSIPFVLYDDDQISAIVKSDLSGARNAFEQAYVLTVEDGGGDKINNGKTVSFVRNVPIDDTGLLSIVRDHWDSKANETDLFWVGYLVSAYEYAPCHAYGGAIRGDGDPDHEQPVYGITPPGGTTNNSNLAVGGDVSFIFMEAERDGRASSARRIWRKIDHAVNVAHEIGHQFGLSHAQEGLMSGTLVDGKIFKPQSINLIRSRVHSPGETGSNQ